MLLDTPSSGEMYVRPEEIWRIINDGHVPVRDKAIMAVLLYMGMDESTLTSQFNVYAYPQLVKELGGSIIHPGSRWAICRDSEGSPFGLASSHRAER